MSEVFRFHDHMMLLADYKDPEPHKHLAAHIIVSLGQEMDWQIEQECVKCRGICIGPNIMHSGMTSKDGTIVFLFTEISNYAFSLDQEHLHGKPYAVLEDEVIERVLCEYRKHSIDRVQMDASILSICGVTNHQNYHYDDRIKEVLSYINELETIDGVIVDELSQQVYLSKSRLSHLFREQTGMTLHSYLAFEKLRKAYQYFGDGRNITESCMLAGFDSPSHCAATCKRMFGISVRDVYKTIATK
jgi:AraC-like DNA-binding protein